MAKKRKMIDIEDLLDEQFENKNNDMVFITATNETTPPSKSEKVYMNRLDRIRSSAVNVDEPLFDGVTDLDMGTVSMSNEDDAQRIKKSLLDQKNITDASDKHRDTIVDEMRGTEPEDVVENFNLDINTVPLENINRTAEKKANSKVVQEILDDLHKKR